MIYVDTSVVVMSLDKSEPARSTTATELLDESVGKVVSEIFLVELAAAISRKEELIDAVAEGDVKPQMALLAYLVYLMSKYDLRLLESSDSRIFTPLGRVSAESGSSLGLAARLKLRSLDLFHVAHLLSLKDRGYGIDAILTSDGEFLKAQKLLSERGVKVILQGSNR